MIGTTQKVWKIEWSQFLGSTGSATRMIVEACDRHSLVVFASHPSAAACGSYDGTCSYCEGEAV